MKIAFLGLKDKDKEKYFTENLSGHDLKFIDQDISEESLPDDREFEAISVFVKSRVTKGVIDSLPKLKFIATRSTGFDNIDIQYAKEKGILVSNVPAYGSNTVAEFTFGLILSLSRKVPAGIDRVKVAKEFNFEGLRGFDLFNKTLGVIGTGKIGSNVVKIGKGFGMKVLAHDAYPKEDLAKTLQFEYLGLNELLQQSDIVTLHVPATPDTKHLINSENISLMKPSGVLINTSRGAVIETEALLNWLKTNVGALAGLDVLEEEKTLTDQEKELVSLPNVIVTPHMAFFTVEAELAIAQTTAQNIKQFVAGRSENLVT